MANIGLLELETKYKICCCFYSLIHTLKMWLNGRYQLYHRRCSSKTFKTILLMASSYVFLHTRIRSRTPNIWKREINIRSLKVNTTGCMKYATVQMQGVWFWLLSSWTQRNRFNFSINMFIWLVSLKPVTMFAVRNTLLTSVILQMLSHSTSSVQLLILSFF